MFHETLDKLRKLQEIFNKKFQLEKNLSELPKEIETHEKMVVQLKQEFLLKNEQYTNLKKNVIIKQDQINILQEKRTRYEKDIGLVNSQRDYEKIDGAIKEIRENEQILIKDLHTMEKALSDFREEFESTEHFLKEQEQSLNSVKENVKKQISQVEIQLKEFKEQEINISSELNSNLVFKFERIVRSKEGEGIVPIRKNICYGCHMILPVQFVNEVRKEKEVLTCLYCSKIVYYSGDSDLEEAGSIEVSGLQDIVDEEDIEMDDLDSEDYTDFIDKDDLSSDDDAYVPNSLINEDDDPIERDSDSESDTEVEENGLDTPYGDDEDDDF